MTCDSRGNATQVQDPTGQVTNSTYQNDLPTAITQVGADGNHTTSFTYDSSSNPLTTTDANGNVTRFSYGSDGNVLTLSDPLGDTLSNAYDANDNLLSTTSAKGVETDYGYDAHGNLVRLEGVNEINTACNDMRAQGWQQTGGTGRYVVAQGTW